MIEWNEEQLDHELKEKGEAAIFFYTPLCGTCQLAKKMVMVAEAMTEGTEVGMCNLNFMPAKAAHYEIESVPCLVIVKEQEIQKKIYAFHSIEYVLEELKSI